jgi:hypothetical protein
MGTAADHGEPATLLFVMLFILYVAQYVLFHINCSFTSFYSMVHHRRANIASLDYVRIDGVKCVGWEV